MRRDRYELGRAKHFVRYLTRQELDPIDKPDAPGHRSRPQGDPDYVFKDRAGNQYVLELMRLLSPELRRLEEFVYDTICVPLENRLPGTYTLEIQIDKLNLGVMAASDAQRILHKVLALVTASRLDETQALSNGYVLAKATEEGSRLVPWLTVPELPYNLKVHDRAAKKLQRQFDAIVHDADNKFSGFSGWRILLIDLSQSSLDWEFHAERFRDGKGVLLTWAEQIGGKLTNVDFIYLEPGLKVWQVSDMRRVLAGHKYVDSPAGFYLMVWRRPGVQGQVRSFL